MGEDLIADRWSEIGRLYERITEAHRTAGGSVMAATAAAEERVLSLIDREIASGDAGAYVIKAHLASCNNWYTGVIARISQFRQILLEGIEHSLPTMTPVGNGSMPLPNVMTRRNL